MTPAIVILSEKLSHYLRCTRLPIELKNAELLLTSESEIAKVPVILSVLAMARSSKGSQPVLDNWLVMPVT